MFERFSREARQVVVEAEDECRRLHGSAISSIHLLLALARDQRPLAGLLARHGLSHATLDEHAGEALATHGLDADTVRKAWRRRLAGSTVDRARRRSGRLPCRADARKGLRLSLREAIRLRSREVAVEHLALGILRDPGPVLRPVLVALAVDVPGLRRDLELRLRPAA